jgi:hypothetical protein
MSAEQTYAERLRGPRFWVPLLVLAVVAVTVLVVESRETHQASGAPLPGPVATAGVDPVVGSVLQRLSNARLLCGGRQVAAPDQVSCLFGAAQQRTVIHSYPSHRSVLKALTATERDAKPTQSGPDVRYAVVGGRWLITGVWSVTGDYAAVDTPEATLATDATDTLNGCLELLPREAGSCAF